MSSKLGPLPPDQCRGFHLLSKEDGKEKGKFKQLAELRTFDEKLRHYAELRISFDLDDGVKVNYGKFGDLLAEVNAVIGGEE